MDLDKILSKLFTRFRVLAVCLAIAAYSSCRAAEEQVLWTADFGGASLGPVLEFADESSASSDAISIVEEDGARLLRKAKGRKQFLFRNLTKEIGGDWENYRVKLRFRQMGDVWMGVVVKQALPAARLEQGYLWYYLVIRNDRIELGCHGREVAFGAYGKKDFVLPEEVRNDPRYQTTIRFDEMDTAPFHADEWVDAAVSVRNESLKVVLATDDGATREFELKTFPGRGHCGVFVGDSETDIASFVVEELNP